MATDLNKIADNIARVILRGVPAQSVLRHPSLSGLGEAERAYIINRIAESKVKLVD